MPRKPKDLEKYQIEMFDKYWNPIDENGNILPERNHEQLRSETPVKSLQNNANFQLNSVVDDPNIIPDHSDAIQNISQTKKDIHKAIPKRNPTELRMGGKYFEYIISPINDDLWELILEFRIRKKWESRYEKFQLSLNPISFSFETNRADGSQYCVWPRIISFKTIIKNGGKAKNVFGARGEYSDERKDITSFNYFRYLFGSYEVDCHAVITNEIKDFINYYYRPSIED